MEIPEHPTEQVSTVRFEDWLVTLIITLVPILNIVMLILWATEQNTNPNKANWAKATLVVIGIQIVITMFFVGAFIGSVSSAMSSLGAAGLW